MNTNMNRGDLMRAFTHGKVNYSNVKREGGWKKNLHQIDESTTRAIISESEIMQPLLSRNS